MDAFTHEQIHVIRRAGRCHFMKVLRIAVKGGTRLSPRFALTPGTGSFASDIDLHVVLIGHLTGADPSLETNVTARAYWTSDVACDTVKP